MTPEHEASALAVRIINTLTAKLCHVWNKKLHYNKMKVEPSYKNVTSIKMQRCVTESSLLLHVNKTFSHLCDICAGFSYLSCAMLDTV